MRYVPILKGKAAELGALQTLEATRRAHVTPLVEPLRTKDDGSSTEAFLTGQVTTLSKALGGYAAVMLDFHLLGSEAAKKGRSPAEYIAPALFQAGVTMVPVERVGSGRLRGGCAGTRDHGRWRRPPSLL